jgi:hypothetical protein
MDPTNHGMDCGITSNKPFIGFCDMCELPRPITHIFLSNYDDCTVTTILCDTCGIGGA